MPVINDDSMDMDCPHCAEKIKRTAKKCKHCHEFLGSESPETTQSDRKEGYETIFTKKYIIQDKLPTLWNPNVAACLSLFFTPIFGAWLHARNWSALNDDKKAKTSMMWVYGCSMFLIFTILLPVAVDVKIADPLYNLLSLIALIVLFTWYFTLGKKQYTHVKNDLKGQYKRKSFLKPILLTLGAFILLSCFAAVLPNSYLPTEPANEEKVSELDNALSQLSAVWELDDNSQIALHLSGTQKYIEADGKSLPVKVAEFNEFSKNVSLEVNNDPQNIWLIQQIFNPDGKSFYLSITVADGSVLDLTYVRDL